MERIEIEDNESIEKIAKDNKLNTEDLKELNEYIKEYEEKNPALIEEDFLFDVVHYVENDLWVFHWKQLEKYSIEMFKYYRKEKGDYKYSIELDENFEKNKEEVIKKHNNDMIKIFDRMKKNIEISDDMDELEKKLGLMKVDQMKEENLIKKPEKEKKPIFENGKLTEEFYDYIKRDKNVLFINQFEMVIHKDVDMKEYIKNCPFNIISVSIRKEEEGDEESDEEEKEKKWKDEEKKEEEDEDLDMLRYEFIV